MSIEVEIGLENFDKVPRLEKPSPKPSRMAQGWANPRLRWVAILGGALVVASATGLYLYYHARESTDDAQVDGHLAPVASKIYGNVAAVLVDDNQAVKAGQVLVRIDARDAQAKLDEVRAALAMAESQAQSAHAGVPLTRETTASGNSSADAQLATAEADLVHARLAYEQSKTADLAYARANVEKRQANFELAQADLGRMKPLAEKEEISKQQFDAVAAQARVAESELNADKERLAQAEHNVEILKSAWLAAQARADQARATVSEARANTKQVSIRATDAASASAAVQQAKATLEAAELQLSYATIVAPVDGVVTRKQVEVGQIVQPGQGLLMVVPLQDVWVTANFKETQLANVHAGQRAEIKVDTYGKTLSGHVDSIAGATGARLSLLPPENATGNFVKVVQRIPVKIVLDKLPADKAVLRPGMGVSATIITR